MPRQLLLLSITLLLFNCQFKEKTMTQDDVKIDTLQGTSLLHKPLIRRQISPSKDSLQIAKYLMALNDYSNDVMNADYIIWLGRRKAYLGDYKAAISLFTEGIAKFPNDARFYRHRGHRYITIRQLDLAIADLEQAVQLLQGTEDTLEPDGIPNRLNQPVSSLHTNTWYHLGLAYYLKNDLENALDAFKACLKASKNDDMVVATKHWLYMILRRMQKPDEAEKLVQDIHSDMTIIENDAYHQLLLFYKGELTEAELIGTESLGSNEAVYYGVANWYHYNGDEDEARTRYQKLLDTGNWAGFGYIAAEADLSRM
ncbi:tetratricopeptide repeat protein [Flavobacteriaceae bacterium MAR_2010_105]|nr:tetratricopeptide repeat protein [Flavobacteriaceae bacterium MAR_2010_105]